MVTVDRGRELVVDGPYRWAATGADRAELNAGAGAGTSSGVARVKEVRYPNARQTLGAFARGEVAFVAHVPPDHVAALAKTPEIKVGRYDRPVTHRIAFDGRNPVLRNRSLRRGLSYAVDRKTLLEETLLRRAGDDANGPSDGVFLKGDFADAPDVAPLGYDPLLARMLVAAAQKEMGGQPIKLNLEYPATPEAQAVVPKLVEAFRLAGVTAVPAEKPESVLESELPAGRRFDLAYRATRYDDAVADVGPLISPAYDAPPSSDPLASLASPRILQLLLQLERAPNSRPRRGWPSRSTASAATSCRSCPSGRSRSITPGTRASRAPRTSRARSTTGSRPGRLNRGSQKTRGERRPAGDRLVDGRPPARRRGTCRRRGAPGPPRPPAVPHPRPAVGRAEGGSTPDAARRWWPTG